MPTLAVTRISSPPLITGTLTDSKIRLAISSVSRADHVIADHDELVAAEPGRGVARPNRLRDPLGDGAQQLVARGMTERVVDVLEAIDVDEDDAGLRAAPARRRQALEQAIREQRAVRQTGERIVQRLVRELLLHLLARGEVLELREEVLGFARFVSYQS